MSENETTANPYPIEVLGEDCDDGTMPGNVESLSAHVVGHKIVAINQKVKTKNSWGSSEYATVLTLDNGKIVKLVDTDDCCAFTQMEDVTLNLDRIDHVILGVGTTDGYATWHIYADLGDVATLQVGWSPGNPFYYGYGFDIAVTDVDGSEVQS